jgi:arginase
MAIALLDAPSNLGLMPPNPGQEPGVRRLPDALRACRLLEKLGVVDGGRILAPAYQPEIDPHTGVRNASAIASYSRALAAALEPILEQGDFPLVLGGDCSILLGSALALSHQGRFGLCFVDGHQDLLTPVTSSTGGAAGLATRWLGN